MNSLLSQVSFPVFLSIVFVFFLIASVFSFFVGLALAFRSQKALRFFEVMNRWISVRRVMKPLSTPHYIEPVLMKRRAFVGSGLVVGALLTIYLLARADLASAFSLFDGTLSAVETEVMAGNLKGFLLVGNAICVLVGILILFFPDVLSRIEAYADRWISFRRGTQPLERMHMEVDTWVLKHPTSAGIVLSILSLSVGFLMLGQLRSVLA